MLLPFLLCLIFAPIGAVIIIALPFQIIKILGRPSMNRDWSGLHTRLPTIKIDDHGEMFVHNVRNFTYNQIFEYEFKEKWENKRYNFNKLKRLWMAVNPYQFLQSHVLLSFEFEDDIFLTVSYEIRKVSLEDFKATNLIWTNFEGLYLVSSENDTLYVRTNVRKEYEQGSIYLFPIIADKIQIQSLFLDLMQEINEYSKKPKFYSFFYRNCVTEIFKHLKKARIFEYSSPLELSFMMWFLYKSKKIEGAGNVSFNKFKEKYYVTEKAQKLRNDSHFSVNIRKDLI
jgi:hypothetical protein